MKRFIAGIVLLTLLLSGCGAKTGGTSEVTEPVESSTSTTTAEPTKPSTEPTKPSTSTTVAPAESGSDDYDYYKHVVNVDAWPAVTDTELRSYAVFEGEEPVRVKSDLLVALEAEEKEAVLSRLLERYVDDFDVDTYEDGAFAIDDNWLFGETSFRLARNTKEYYIDVSSFYYEDVRDKWPSTIGAFTELTGLSFSLGDIDKLVSEGVGGKSYESDDYSTKIFWSKTLDGGFSLSAILEGEVLYNVISGTVQYDDSTAKMDIIADDDGSGWITLKQSKTFAGNEAPIYVPAEGTQFFGGASIHVPNKVLSDYECTVRVTDPELSPKTMKFNVVFKTKRIKDDISSTLDARNNVSADKGVRVQITWPINDKYVYHLYVSSPTSKSGEYKQACYNYVEDIVNKFLEPYGVGVYDFDTNTVT